MGRQKVVDEVKEAVLPVIEATGLELVDVTYGKEESRWYLRIFIDQSKGVSLDDCQMVSEKISRVLDNLDLIPQAYFLEVSSPGIERPLKKADDFRRFAGRLVNIVTFVPVAGQKKFTGCLKGLCEDEVLLEVKGVEMAVPLEQIASARLTVEF